MSCCVIPSNLSTPLISVSFSPFSYSVPFRSGPFVVTKPVLENGLDFEEDESDFHELVTVYVSFILFIQLNYLD